MNLLLASYLTTTLTYNMFVAGDKVWSSWIETPFFEYKEGTNQFWDMSNLEVIKKNIPSTYYHPQDSIWSEYTAKLQNSTSTYYELVDNKIYCKGFDNHTTSIKYDIPEAIQHVNVAFGQSLNGHYSGRGTYAAKDSFLIYGDYQTEIIAKGTLLTPEENNLNDVLLQHTKRELDYYDFHNAPIHLTMIENKWFVPNYRYPIIENRKLLDATGKCLEDNTYYTPLNKQKLYSDIVNEKGISTPNLTQNENKEDFINISCNNINLKQNSDKIELEFYNDKEQKVTFGIYTNEGIVIFHQPAQWFKKGLIKQEINLHLLMNKAYIFIIEQGEQKHSYKFIAK